MLNYKNPVSWQMPLSMVFGVLWGLFWRTFIIALPIYVLLYAVGKGLSVGITMASLVIALKFVIDLMCNYFAVTWFLNTMIRKKVFYISFNQKELDTSDQKDSIIPIVFAHSKVFGVLWLVWLIVFGINIFYEEFDMNLPQSFLVLMFAQFIAFSNVLGFEYKGARLLIYNNNDSD